MKKQVLFLATALTAISLGVQGCAGKEAAETTAAATAAAETTAAETTAVETTEAETEEAGADTETGIPAEYEAYLDWTADEWSTASDEEKQEAVIAYVLYDGINYQGIDDLTADDIKGMAELEQIFSIVDAGIQGSGGSSLKEICDMGHSASMSLDELDLDDSVIEALQCTAKDWAAADDAGKKEVVKAMLLAVGQMTGQEITMEMIDTLSDADMDAQVQNIGAMFESGLYDDDVTLYEMLSQQ